MRQLLLLGLIALMACGGAGVKTAQQGDAVVADSCVDFNTVIAGIRDGSLKKEEAMAQMLLLLPQVKDYYYKYGGKDEPKSKWVFPLKGYNANAIGGTNGSGYVAAGYKFLDGNKHKGHPAHDIFIQDVNQDCKDDRTQKPVQVLSVSDGIVLATETKWDTASEQRGGNYIWIYDPSGPYFFYYAHNDTLLVKPCDIVKPGDAIATVGRSGFNAYKKRSPTHLHFMLLQLDDKMMPYPVNTYTDLVKMKTMDAKP